LQFEVVSVLFTLYVIVVVVIGFFANATKLVVVPGLRLRVVELFPLLL